MHHEKKAKSLKVPRFKKIHMKGGTPLKEGEIGHRKTYTRSKLTALISLERLPEIGNELYNEKSGCNVCREIFHTPKSGSCLAGKKEKTASCSQNRLNQWGERDAEK